MYIDTDILFNLIVDDGTQKNHVIKEYFIEHESDLFEVSVLVLEKTFEMLVSKEVGLKAWDAGEKLLRIIESDILEVERQEEMIGYLNLIIEKKANNLVDADLITKNRIEKKRILRLQELYNWPSIK